MFKFGTSVTYEKLQSGVNTTLLHHIYKFEAVALIIQFSLQIRNHELTYSLTGLDYCRFIFFSFVILFECFRFTRFMIATKFGPGDSVKEKLEKVISSFKNYYFNWVIPDLEFQIIPKLDNSVPVKREPRVYTAPPDDDFEVFLYDTLHEIFNFDDGRGKEKVSSYNTCHELLLLLSVENTKHIKQWSYDNIFRIKNLIPKNMKGKKEMKKREEFVMMFNKEAEIATYKGNLREGKKIDFFESCVNITLKPIFNPILLCIRSKVGTRCLNLEIFRSLLGQSIPCLSVESSLGTDSFHLPEDCSDEKQQHLEYHGKNENLLKYLASSGLHFPHFANLVVKNAKNSSTLSKSKNPWKLHQEYIFSPSRANYNVLVAKAELVALCDNIIRRHIYDSKVKYNEVSEGAFGNYQQIYTAENFVEFLLNRFGITDKEMVKQSYGYLIYSLEDEYKEMLIGLGHRFDNVKKIVEDYEFILGKMSEELDERANGALENGRPNGLGPILSNYFETHKQSRALMMELFKKAIDVNNFKNYLESETLEFDMIKPRLRAKEISSDLGCCSTISISGHCAMTTRSSVCSSCLRFFSNNGNEPVEVPVEDPELGNGGGNEIIEEEKVGGCKMGPWKIGDEVDGSYRRDDPARGKWRPGEISKVNSDGTYDIVYNDDEGDYDGLRSVIKSNGR